MKREHNEAVRKIFNPEEDIIIPETIWGEIYYIFCSLVDIKNSRLNERAQKMSELKRQIRIFFKWLRNS